MKENLEELVGELIFLHPCKSVMLTSFEFETTRIQYGITGEQTKNYLAYKYTCKTEPKPVEQWCNDHGIKVEMVGLKGLYKKDI